MAWYGYDDAGIAEILGTVALWSEVTRFNIARWRQVAPARDYRRRRGGGA